MSELGFGYICTCSSSMISSIPTELHEYVKYGLVAEPKAVPVISPETVALFVMVKFVPTPVSSISKYATNPTSSPLRGAEE